MTGPDSTQGPILPRLRRLRALARAVLLFEQVWPAVWPALGVLGLFVCFALLDLPRRLPAALHGAMLAALVLAMFALLWRGLRAVRLPNVAQADRRLEQDSGLRHRPLAVLADRPALPGAEALWRAHVARMLAQIGRLRLAPPRPGLAARDPRALRLGLLVAIAACLVIAGTETPSRLLRAAVPQSPPATPVPATEVQGWITPPGYTDLPPVFLRPAGGTVSVPAGSHLTVSLSGGNGAPTLTLDGADLAFLPVDAGSYQADADLTAGGKLTVRRNGVGLAAWDIAVVPDTAPLVRWTEPPGPAHGNSRIPATRLPWQVSHEYGVTGLQAELRLAIRQDAPALTIAIPLPGGSAKAAKGVKTQDLTAHPWAGIAVSAKLVAHDAAGLVGESDTVEFTLPERHFDNAVARALLAVRKRLTLWPEERLPAAGELDRIAQHDPVWQSDLGALLNLRAIIAELSHTRGRAAVEEAQGRLWQLALHLEESGADRTARELSEARRALHDAMQAERPDRKEIERRIAELEAAIQKHLDALAEELKRDPDAVIGDRDAPQISPQHLKDLAEQLKQDTEQGKPEDAQKKLAELEKLLDKLQNAKPMHRDAKQREQERKRKRGRDEMSALQDIVQREGQLLDHTQQRAGNPSAPPGDGAAERAGDQRVQQALRRALGELMQEFGDLAQKVPPNLGEAETDMHAAGEALGKAQDPKAVAAMQAAIEALQKGGQSMSELLAQQFGQPGEDPGDQDKSGQSQVGLGEDQEGDTPGDGNGTRNDQGGRSGNGRGGERSSDPLGRPMHEGGNGNNEAADMALPADMEQARTRAIQDELRKRGGERSRPQPELDYIDRLLKQF